MKKSWKKIALALVLAGNTVSTSIVPANAAQVHDTKSEVIDVTTPWYIGFTSFSSSVDEDTAGLRCSGSIRLRSGYTAEMTMELERRTSSYWENMRTWTCECSGNTILERYAAVSLDYDYRVIVNVVVMDSEGNIIEEESSVATYNGQT